MIIDIEVLLRAVTTNFVWSVPLAAVAPSTLSSDSDDDGHVTSKSADPL